MSPGLKLALLTCDEHPRLTDDDRLLLPELAARGWEARPLIWDRERPAPGEMLLIRSIWDYYLKPQSYFDWLGALERAGARIFNPVATVRWNSDKKYLRELEAAGIRIPATEWVGDAASTDLRAVARARGWSEAVVKPRVSASAHGTFRFRANDAVDPRASGECLLQEFRPEVVEFGEVSLLYFGGAFSHAVRKSPRAGDFRVQSDHGGTVAPFDPGRELLGQAEAVLERIPGSWLYARVDGVLERGELVLMELELIEPNLFLAESSGAAARLADALSRMTGD